MVAVAAPWALLAVSPASGQPVPPPVVAEEDLRAALSRYLSSDIIRNPRPTVAALPDLIRRAALDPRFTYEEVVAARHTLAFARTYDNDHAGGIADLDQLAAEMRSRNYTGPLFYETLRRKAVILSSLKKYSEAAAIYLDLIDREEKAGHGDSAMVSATLNGLAIVRAREGKYAEGEAIARKATAIGLAAADAKPQAVGDAWRVWVVLLGLTDKRNEAIVEAQRSLKYNEAHLDEANESTVGSMNNLSVMLSDVGRYTEAEAIQRRMIEVERAQPTTQGQTMAIYLGNFGGTLMAQGKAAEAEVMLRRARELMLTVKHLQRPDFLGRLSLDLGNVLYAQGRQVEALTLFRTALAELARDAGTDHPAWAQAQADIAKVLIDQNKIAEALEPLRLARTVMSKRLDPLDHIRLTTELLAGEALSRVGDASGYGLARSAIASERSVLVSAAIDPLRSALMARERVGSFTRFAQLALAQGELADAFEALQLAQFSDLDSAGTAWATQQAAATPGLARAISELRASGSGLKKLQAKRSDAVAKANTQALADIDREIEATQVQSAALLGALASEFPAYVNLVRPEPRRLKDVQAALRPDQALVIAMPSDKGGVISLVVTSTQAAGAVVKLPPKALNAWAARLRASIDQALGAPGPAAYDGGAAYALFSAIIPPSIDRVARRAPHLLVQAGGVLASVPLAALLTAKPRTAMIAGAALRSAPWLIRRQALSRPVSLATLNMVRTARGTSRFAGVGAPLLKGGSLASAGPGAVAGLMRAAQGDNNFVAELPPLPGAEAELLAMASALGEKSPLMMLGQGATRKNLMAENLQPYDVIAFATHGLVGGEIRNLTEPALVMTPSADGTEGATGLLTASDVAGLRLNADWVILSACNTSAGEEGAAPIYTGLARAFVQAGARSLLLSQWPLRDDVAAKLTVETVRLSAQGLDRAQSLRRAQTALIAERSMRGTAHPALWASLILIGD